MAGCLDIGSKWREEDSLCATIGGRSMLYIELFYGRVLVLHFTKGKGKRVK